MFTLFENRRRRAKQRGKCKMRRKWKTIHMWIAVRAILRRSTSKSYILPENRKHIQRKRKNITLNQLLDRRFWSNLIYRRNARGRWPEVADASKAISEIIMAFACHPRNVKSNVHEQSLKTSITVNHIAKRLKKKNLPRIISYPICWIATYIAIYFEKKNFFSRFIYLYIYICVCIESRQKEGSPIDIITLV